MTITVTPESMDFSEDEIVEMCSWANFNGFTGETCSKCKKTANVLSGRAGWCCPCGHYNCLPFYGSRTPHEKPNYGPSRAKLLAAYKRDRKRQGKK